MVFLNSDYVLQDYSVSELIYYDRPDTEGPKLSVYSKCNIPHGDDLLNILTMALGVRGVVKKTRHLYIHDQTRIHVDDVEGLGKFVELEVNESAFPLHFDFSTLPSLY